MSTELVIGESARPDHWSIYGYPRETTPRLARNPNVIAFRNAIAQVAVTRVSVPLILTRGTLEHPGRTARERSIVSAFNEVGFRTHWLSTQQSDPYTGVINRYSSEATSQRFFERRFDEILAEHAAKLLGDKAEKKLFLVLHMMGSHFEYTSRYPDRFDKFDASAPGRAGLVNAYDNTLLYTDYVVSRVILH